MIDKIQKVKNAMGFLLSAAYPEMIASEHKRNNDVLAELCKLVDSLKQDCFVSSKKCWAEVPITIPPNEDGVYMCLPQKDAFTYHNGMWWHGAYRVDGITHWLEPYTPPVEDGKQGGEVDLKEFSRCINALALELPALVWDDVYSRWLKLKSSIIKSQSQPSTPVQDGWVRVEDVIYAIRESFVGADKVYTQGSCYQFYKILKSIFPQAIDYYDMNHVVTEIDGVCYDINGVVDKGICLLMSEHYPDAGVKNYRYNIYDNAIEQWKLQP